MVAKQNISSLSATYYIIDTKQKKITHTNDYQVDTEKEHCLKELFFNNLRYKEENEECILEKILSSKNKEHNIILRGVNEESHKTFKLSINHIQNNTLLAILTDITEETDNTQKKLNFFSVMEQAEKLAQIGSWEINLYDDTIRVSEGLKQIYGIRDKENIFSLSRIRANILSDYQELLNRKLDDLLHKGKAYETEIQIKRESDGQIRTIKTIAEYESYKNIVYGVSKDITDKIKVKDDLNKSVSELKLAQQIGKIGNWNYNPENDELYGSDQIFEIFEEEKMDIPIKFNLFSYFIDPNDFKAYKEVFTEAKNKGITISKQLKIKLNNGKEKWVEIISKPDKIKGEYGHSIKGTVQDITSTKTIELELAKANLLLHTLVDNIPDALFLKDLNYRRILSNKADLENCNVSKLEDIIGKTDFEIFPKEFADKFHEDDKQVIEKGIKIFNHEEMLPGNPPRWLQVTKIPLKNENGAITGVIGVGHDITQRKKLTDELEKAKQRAEESDRLKSLFLANMSHEIRTPLNVILGFSNIIISGDIKGEKLNYYGEIIEQSGHKLTTIINDIIDISLIQSNQIKISNSFFNVNTLFDEIFLIMKKEKESKLENINFSIDYCSSPENKYMNSDKNRVFQILRNLLDNAFKFTETGHIRFGCSSSKCSDENIVIYVEDSGIGIEEKEVNVIFKPFRQIAEEFQTNTKGNGLGLSIVSGIVKRLGGKIWLKSVPGKGSTFYVLIPRRLYENSYGNLRNLNALKSDAEKTNDKTIKKTSGKKRVVSFEDDPANAEYLKSVVNLSGYELINFDFPPDGIDFLRKNHVDLVLMDVRMPVMDGFEATKIIKSEFPDLPVIIQTAFAMKGDEEKAIQAGCDAYISKPIPLDVLKRQINLHIKK